VQVILRAGSVMVVSSAASIAHPAWPGA
jgi:hypothetical protein